MPKLQIAIDVLFGISAFYNACIYLPQIYRLVKIKQSDELSLTMFILFCVTQSIQIAYTYLIADAYVYALGISLVLIACATTTILIVYYRCKYFSLKRLIGIIQKYKWQLVLFCIAIIVATVLVCSLTVGQLEYILSILFDGAFVIVSFSFIFQIIKIIRNKHAKEFSVITFAGFNVIQIITALYAYYHHITPLFIGMLLYLATNGSLTLLIVYYKHKNHEF